LEMQEEDAVAMLACDGPLVVRRVVGQRDRVDVLDEVATDEPHQVTWQFAPGWSLHPVGHRAWELVGDEGVGFRLELEGGDPQAEVVQRTVSRAFLQTETAVALRVCFVRGLRTRLRAVSSPERV
ncbi:MAG: hypothetical protein KDK99_17225, partial [Verrucomicrobiales bacterium]|nr:hypothetical protein [Verrucomicrobiales bacterium]